jgi:(2Fe-2S) ferredoxin
MDATRVERVVEQHVIGGQIVREFIERPGILHSVPVGSRQKDS